MANIRCSLCNILPIQIKNLDDYLCEQDHVVCKKCIIFNSQRELICPLCKSRIIKNRKILIETSETGINSDYDIQIPQVINTISNNNFSDEDGNSRFADDMQFWANQCMLQSPPGSINSSYIYQNSEINGNGNGVGNGGGGGGMKYHMGDVPSGLYGFDQNAKRCPGDENMCFDRNIFLKNEMFDPSKDIINDNKTNIKINSDFNNSIASHNEHRSNDTMFIYHKTNNGKSDQNFDPQKHYYETVHYKHEKNEPIKNGTSIILVKKSTEKNNDENVLHETESAIVLKRFAECQESTNNNNNVSKNIIAPILTFTYNSVVNTTTPQDSCPSEAGVQTIFERPKSIPKTSTNNSNSNSNDNNNNNEKKQSNNFQNSMKNNNLQNKYVSHQCQKPSQNKIFAQQSTRTMLRNQIKQMTYSNIKENDQESEKNGKFIAQNQSYKPSPLISLHIDRNKDNDKSQFYTGVIQHHLSKAMEDLIMNEQNSRNARREKRAQIVQQEREIIRNRIKDEIYKGLQTSNEIPINDTLSSCENKSIKTINEIDSIKSEHEIKSFDFNEQPNSNENFENTASDAKEFRNISLSTESYPKLNPQLHVLSETLSNFDKKYSKLHEEPFDEIKKRFEKQTKLELELIAAIDNKSESKPVLCESISISLNADESINRVSGVISKTKESNNQILNNIFEIKSNNSQISDNSSKNQESQTVSNQYIKTLESNNQINNVISKSQDSHQICSNISKTQQSSNQLINTISKNLESNTEIYNTTYSKTHQSSNQIINKSQESYQICNSISKTQKISNQITNKISKDQESNTEICNNISKNQQQSSKQSTISEDSKNPTINYISKTQQSNNEIINKISKQQQSNSQIILKSQESNSQIYNNISNTPSNIIDIKLSEISDISENLKTETSAQDVQTLHEAPEMRNVKMNSSIVINNDRLNEEDNQITEQDPEITDNTFLDQFSQDNIVSQTEIKSFDQNLNMKNSGTNNEELGDINDYARNSLTSFIELLKLKNPLMSNTDIHEIIKYLPTATNSEIKHAIEKLPTKISNTMSVSSSETLIDDITICSEMSEDDATNILYNNNNAWRAYYNPPTDFSCQPEPQIRPIKLDKKSIFKIEPKLAGKLSIERHPVNCPITSCKRKVFISEFTKHMKVDHTKTFIESISPGECRNLFLDPKVVHHGVNKCHNLYLVTDKIRDLGSREYKNYLPIMLMSTKISLLELTCPSFRPKDDAVINCKQNFIVIWLTGLVASELPIYYTLVVWSRSGEIPKCHKVHSGTLYSFRDEQNARILFKKGQAIVLSKPNCDQLTDNGRNMVELQVTIH